MIPEHLELYQKLSETKIYKERLGEWKTGDKVYHYEKEEYRFFCHEAIPYLAFQTGHGEVLISPKDVALLSIRIPPVFDLERPERCLWGMVDWESSHSVCPEADTGIVSLYSGDRQGTYGPLDIALIKFILEQEKK